MPPARKPWWGCASDELLKDNGIALWLWFEALVGLSLVTLGISPIAVAKLRWAWALASLGAAVCLALGWGAYALRGRAGWVDIYDGGWDELVREARSGDCPEANWPKSPPGNEPGGAAAVAQISNARAESFRMRQHRIVALSLFSALVSTGLVVIALIHLAEPSNSFLGSVWVAVVVLLGVSASTLPFFANVHFAVADDAGVDGVLTVVPWCFALNAVTLLAAAAVTKTTRAICRLTGVVELHRPARTILARSGGELITVGKVGAARARGDRGCLCALWARCAWGFELRDREGVEITDLDRPPEVRDGVQRYLDIELQGGCRDSMGLDVDIDSIHPDEGFDSSESSPASAGRSPVSTRTPTPAVRIHDPLAAREFSVVSRITQVAFLADDAESFSIDETASSTDDGDADDTAGAPDAAAAAGDPAAAAGAPADDDGSVPDDDSSAADDSVSPGSPAAHDFYAAYHGALDDGADDARREGWRIAVEP
ncbi:hypothetical protein M885DRAFT_504646 [Pelagophyceae sp. CCMP2097]|nr:hypothetical protein M885DRAFT_504646 [Pelagophyceae sp. CCMP2097]